MQLRQHSLEETIKAIRNTLGAGPGIVSEIPYLTPAWELKEQVKYRLYETKINCLKNHWRTVIKNYYF